MKKMYSRMATMIVAMTMTTAMHAESTDSLSTDSTKWYNQTQRLNEVVIKSSLPKTRAKGDAMRTSVAGSVLEKAGTANDVLTRIPNIEAASNDGVKVWGRGAAEVYINGRKMLDANELSRLRSEQIQYVEVVQNPGARYAASTKATEPRKLIIGLPCEPFLVVIMITPFAACEP